MSDAKKARTTQLATQLASSFWARVDMSGGESSCWPWSKYSDRAGYGKVWWEGSQKLAHRIAFELHGGASIPPGLCVCHRCDNPPCCNPSHLFVGTHTDNVRDSMAKGRARPPTCPYPAVMLTAEMAESVIRDSRFSTYRRIAKRLGVSHGTVQRIVHGKKKPNQ